MSGMAADILVITEPAKNELSLEDALVEIGKLRKENALLRKRLRKVQCTEEKGPNKKSKKWISTAIQTESDQHDDSADSDVQFMWSQNSSTSNSHVGTTNGVLQPDAHVLGQSNQNDVSVADLVRMAAEQTVTEQALPGYVLDQNSGFYFNHQTGYYYDPRSTLFYHSSTQLYYMYDRATGEYNVYDKTQQCEKQFSSRRYRRLGKNYDLRSVDTGVFEWLMDALDQVDFFVEGKISPNKTYLRRLESKSQQFKDHGGAGEYVDLTKESDGEISGISLSDGEEGMDAETIEILKRKQEEEDQKLNAPCIRLMELPSNRLHIVTIAGAVLGKSDSSDIKLSEDINSVSKKHAKIYYNGAKRRYFIEDLNSRQGTSVNDEFVSTKTRLEHGDVLRLGEKQLNVHLHTGSNTCNGCEPGLLDFGKTVTADNTPALTKAAKEELRRKQLRDLKRSYGLQNGESSNKNQSSKSSSYQDRASERRKTVGSEHSAHSKPLLSADLTRTVYSETQLRTFPSKTKPFGPSSKTPIDSENKGFKLLSKMGWKEGQGIGKNEQGIAQPINPNMQVNRAGLGTATEKAERAVPMTAKQKMWMNARKRYQQVQSSHPIFETDIQELKRFDKSC